MDEIAEINGIADSDSVAVADHPSMVYTSSQPPLKQSQPRTSHSYGDSWIMGLFLVIVVIVFLRFRLNHKFLKSLATELVSTRERNNFLEDTVRETTFIVILYLLCTVELGVLLFELICLRTPSLTLLDSPVDLGICVAIAMAYSLLMPIGYKIWGEVFLSRVHASMWLRAFGISQSFLGIALLVPVLLMLLHPAWMHTLVVVSLCMFGMIKLLLIFKALRIFIHKFSSWVVFLYYLCSLEIVPLVSAYAAAMILCGQFS